MIPLDEISSKAGPKDVGAIMGAVESLDKIFKYGFLTGSRVFGSNAVSELLDESDWDIVIPGTFKQDFVDDLTHHLPGAKAKPSNYSGGVTISAYNEVFKINLIPAMENDYRAWYYATLAFRDMWMHTGIT